MHTSSDNGQLVCPIFNQIIKFWFLPIDDVKLLFFLGMTKTWLLHFYFGILHWIINKDKDLEIIRKGPMNLFNGELLKNEAPFAQLVNFKKTTLQLRM